MAKSQQKLNILDRLMPALVSILEKELTRALLIKIVGSTTGFKAWLAKFVIEEVLIDEVIVPGLEYGERKLILIYDKANGHYVYKKLEEAADNGNLNEWRNAAREL